MTVPGPRRGGAIRSWGGGVFDNVSDATRNAMLANKGKDTKPEMVVRRALHRMGYRFRVHRKDLPGKPDMVFPARKMIVEVRGCFWHGHNCKIAKLPKSREAYWVPKIEATKARDARNTAQLEAQGWTVIEVWECALRADAEAAIAEVAAALGPPGQATADKTGACLEPFAPFHED